MQDALFYPLLQCGRTKSCTHVCRRYPGGGAGRWSREKEGWGLLPAAFEEEGEDDLVETLGDVDGDVVDVVLLGVALQFGLLADHKLAVRLRHLGGLKALRAAALKVNEAQRPRAVVELQLAGAVEGVEDDDFVLVVAQVAQGVEEVVALAVGDEGVGEEHHERAAVQLLGEEVQRGRYGSGVWRGRSGPLPVFHHPFPVCQLLVQQREEVLLVRRVGTAGGLQVYPVGDEGKPESVALAVQQLYEHGSGVDAEGELVGMLCVIMPFEREKHGAAMVDDKLAAQVRLLLELFDVQSVAATVEPPVDVARALPRIVLAVVGELDGKAVQRTSVTPCDKSLHHLACEKVECLVPRNLGLLHCRKLRMKNEE